MCFLPCCVGAAVAAPVAYYGAKKSISQTVNDHDDSNWIKPEVDPVREEEERQKSIERTKKGFKRRTAAQSVQEKYRSAQFKALK
ncbi:hypothetical protein ABBQ32_004504 [Trebouxia sp. C0010 RCD-2024]